MPIIQWLPAETGVPCSLLTPEGTKEGYCEAAVQNYKQKIVQFERVGFARIDTVKDGRITAYFTHR
jgi:glutamyl-tRNA synthetase